jgi:hypothetical protein
MSNVVFGQFGDERYVVGVTIEVLKYLYESLDKDFFRIETEPGSQSYEEYESALRKVPVYPAWTKEEVTPPLISVNANVRTTVPFGFGSPYRKILEGTDSENKFLSYKVGGHIITGRLMITVITRDYFELRSIRGKLGAMINSPFFVMYMESNGIYLKPPFEMGEGSVEEVSEQVRYYYSTFNTEFRSDWMVGDYEGEEVYGRIRDVASFMEAIENGKVKVELDIYVEK